MAGQVVKFLSRVILLFALYKLPILRANLKVSHIADAICKPLLSLMYNCLSDCLYGLDHNFLLLSADKTEVLIVASDTTSLEVAHCMRSRSSTV